MDEFPPLKDNYKLGYKRINIMTIIGDEQDNERCKTLDPDFVFYVFPEFPRNKFL